MAKEIQRLDIVFKDPVATYKAGDVISGYAQLDLAQELRVKGVKIHFVGAARVHWDEKRTYTKGSAAKLSHRNVDSYLDESFVVSNKGDMLSAGKYNWPFVQRLPLYLPGSYEGQWGRVQYAVKVVLERPWKGDIEAAKSFIVLGVLDLNSEPDARKPVENLLEATVGTGCCKTGIVSGHVTLERRGFSAGQSVPFIANVDNQTTRSLNARIVLSQQATFKADKQVRKHSTVIRVLTKGEVKGRQKMTWHDELKGIPTIPPTRLGGGCKTIEVKYFLTLVLVSTGPGKDLEIPVELIIGTTALRKSDSSGQSLLTVRAAATRRWSGSMSTEDTIKRTESN